MVYSLKKWCFLFLVLSLEEGFTLVRPGFQPEYGRAHTRRVRGIPYDAFEDPWGFDLSGLRTERLPSFFEHESIPGPGISWSSLGSYERFKRRPSGLPVLVMSYSAPVSRLVLTPKRPLESMDIGYLYPSSAYMVLTGSYPEKQPMLPHPEVTLPFITHHVDNPNLRPHEDPPPEEPHYVPYKPYIREPYPDPPRPDPQFDHIQKIPPPEEIQKIQNTKSISFRAQSPDKKGETVVWTTYGKKDGENSRRAAYSPESQLPQQTQPNNLDKAAPFYYSSRAMWPAHGKSSYQPEMQMRKEDSTTTQNQLVRNFAPYGGSRIY